MSCLIEVRATHTRISCHSQFSNSYENQNFKTYFKTFFKIYATVCSLY